MKIFINIFCVTLALTFVSVEVEAFGWLRGLFKQGVKGSVTLADDLTRPLAYGRILECNKDDTPCLNKENLKNNKTTTDKFTNGLKLNTSKYLFNKDYLVLKSGKKELYDFCEEEGFNTTDKGIKNCGLLIEKRLLEEKINPKKIQTSQSADEILNRIEEQEKIIKKLDKRDKLRRFINVYKTYKNLGIL